MGSSRLANILVDQGWVHEQAITDALQLQVVQGGSLGTLLLESEQITEPTLQQALAATFGLPCAGKAEIDGIGHHIPQLLPLVFAETYHLVPLRLEGNELDVLASTPPDAGLQSRIAERLQVSVRVAVTSELRLHYAMNRLYGVELQPRFAALVRKLDGALPAPLPASSAGAGDPGAPPTAATRMLSWGLSTARIDRPGSSQQGGTVAQLRTLLARLESANSRDVVIDVLLQAAVTVLDFAGLFLVHADVVRGWRGTSPEQTQRLARIALPISLPSVFQTVYATQGHYLGPLPKNSINSRFLGSIGRDAPRTAFVAPVRVGGKLAAILYGDNGPRPIPHKRVTALLLLAQRAGLSLEALIRRRKAEVKASPPNVAPAHAVTPITDATAAAAAPSPASTPTAVSEIPISRGDDAEQAEDGAAATPAPPAAQTTISAVTPAAENPAEATQERSPAAAGGVERNDGRDEERSDAELFAGPLILEPPPPIGSFRGAMPSPRAVLRHAPPPATSVRRAPPSPAPAQDDTPDGDTDGDDDLWSSVKLDESNLEDSTGSFGGEDNPSAMGLAFEDGLRAQSSNPDIEIQPDQLSVEVDVDDGDADDDVYVAFGDIEDNAQESLDDWEDVLYDTAISTDDDAPAAPQQPAVSEASLPPPTVTWDDVLTEIRITQGLSPSAPRAPASSPLGAAMVDEREVLLEGLDADSPDVWHSVVQQLLGSEIRLDDALNERFPGKIAFDPFDGQAQIPPFEQCSGITAYIAALGAEAAPVVLQHLEHPNPTHRFFAIYYLLAVQYPPALEALARRLYDTQPQNRTLAAEALRRYTGEAAYHRIVRGLREQLKVPVLDTQIATVLLLGQMREPSAVPSLIPLVVSSQIKLANVAASALAVLCAQAFGQDLAQWQQWWQDHYNRPRVVWLIEGLEHANASIRGVAHRELQQLTGQDIPFDPDGPAQARAQAIARWQAWLQRLSGSRGELQGTDN